MSSSFFNREAASQAVEALLCALGFDPAVTPHLQQTPQRVAAAWIDDLLNGYSVDVVQLLQRESITTSLSSSADLVVLRDVDTTIICPHHLMPALGTATVAYVPSTRLVGLGALARLVDAFAHRLTLQEDVGRNVVDSLQGALETQGAFCRLRLRHSCLCARGERKQGWVETVSALGCLAPGGTYATMSPLLYSAS